MKKLTHYILNIILFVIVPIVFIYYGVVSNNIYILDIYLLIPITLITLKYVKSFKVMVYAILIYNTTCILTFYLANIKLDHRIARIILDNILINILSVFYLYKFMRLQLINKGIVQKNNEIKKLVSYIFWGSIGSIDNESISAIDTHENAMNLVYSNKNIQVNFIQIPLNTYELSIGGDFIDIIDRDNYSFIIVGDSTGHKKCSFKFSLEIITVFRYLTYEHNNILDIVRLLNNHMYNINLKNNINKFATCIIAKISKLGNSNDILSIEYINCGHPIPVKISNKPPYFESTPYDNTGIPIGIIKLTKLNINKYLLNISTTINKDENILLYTDGLLPKDKCNSINLPQYLNKHLPNFNINHLTIYEITNTILNTMLNIKNRFSNIDIDDDLLLVLIQQNITNSKQ